MARRVGFADVRFVMDSSVFDADAFVDANLSYANVSLPQFPHCRTPVLVDHPPDNDPLAQTTTPAFTQSATITNASSTNDLASWPNDAPSNSQYPSRSAPCCLLTTCMLQQEHIWSRPTGIPAAPASCDPNTNDSTSTSNNQCSLEQLEQRQEWSALFIASAYDPLNAKLILGSVTDADMNMGDLIRMAEAVGAHRFSMTSLLRSPGAIASGAGERMRFVMPACLSHTYLVPSMDFMRLRCTHGTADCNATHIGTRVFVQAGTHMSMWLSTALWEGVKVFGRSLQTTITDYTKAGRGSEVFQRTGPDGMPILLWSDTGCTGPNCEESGCPVTIELGQPFHPLQAWGIALTLGFFLLATVLPWIVLASVRFRRTLNQSQPSGRGRGYQQNHTDDGSHHSDNSLHRHATGVQHPSFSGVGAKIVIHMEAVSAWARLPKRDQPEVPSLPGGGKPQQKKLKVLLNRITLSLSRAKVVAIIGPSGSGKSTLLRVLTNQLPAGIQWTGKRSSQVSHFRILRQNTACAFTKLTASEVLAMQALLVSAHPSAVAFVDDWIADFRHTIVGALSGGQVRILATASW